MLVAKMLSAKAPSKGEGTGWEIILLIRVMKIFKSGTMLLPCSEELSWRTPAGWQLKSRRSWWTGQGPLAKVLGGPTALHLLLLLTIGRCRSFDFQRNVNFQDVFLLNVQQNCDFSHNRLFFRTVTKTVYIYFKCF